VFDNWIGVWQSHQSPTVMGRHGTPKKNGIWNDTMLMLQFDEIPDRSIKVLLFNKILYIFIRKCI
jgi:hypothetical protein